jgi:hypothetical protein
MGRHAAVALYVLALIAVVVGVDVLFFRNRFWERLMVNVGIVLVFWAFYLRFLKRHPIVTAQEPGPSSSPSALDRDARSGGIRCVGDARPISKHIHAGEFRYAGR